MKNVPPKIAFPNKPADDMIIGAYVEPLVFGKYAKKGLSSILPLHKYWERPLNYKSSTSWTGFSNGSIGTPV